MSWRPSSPIAYRRAMELYEELAARPDATSYRVWLATIEQSYAILLLHENDLEEAKLHLFESIKAHRPLLEKEEKMPHIRILLTNVYHRLGEVFERMGRGDDARKAFDYGESLRPSGRH